MRSWSNRETDDGSLYAVGNGRMLLYGTGPELAVRGPIYSMPEFGRLLLHDEECVTSVSERESGTLIWRHTLMRRGLPLGVFTDVLDPERCVFYRDMEMQQPLQLSFDYHPDAETYAHSDYDAGAHCVDVVAVWLRKGTRFFVRDTMQEDACLLLTGQGACTLTDEGRCMTVCPGHSRLILSCGTAESATDTLGWALDAPDIAARSAAFTRAFLRQGRAFLARIPSGHPRREAIAAAYENVSLLIKSQQSVCGGVLAGSYYPMAYIRDQAGTLRGLLTLGHLPEAKAILDFWFRKWRLYGNLCNAEGMENDSMRLHYPNDEAEGPAYVILCAFAYARACGGESCLEEWYPMLEWAFRVQMRQLAEGMIGFNGDETYIAGHLLPRECQFQGSAEATLLFIQSGEQLLAFAERAGHMSNEERQKGHAAVADARARFHGNFVQDGCLYVNQPAREKVAEPPRFIFGVCQRHERLPGQPLVITWVERGRDGYYRCPACRDQEMPSRFDPQERYRLSSVSLLPAYHHSTLFDDDELRSFAEPFIKRYRETGSLPGSREDPRALGYDFGLLLCTLSRLHDPLREDALNTLLDIVDATGAWGEYYCDNRPYFSCRCRPWESAINMEAIAHYLDSL